MKPDTDSPKPGTQSTADKVKALEKPTDENFQQAEAATDNEKKKQIAIQAAPLQSLANILPRLTVDKLRIIYRNQNTISGPGKRSKQQLIDELLSLIPRADELRRFIQLQPDIEWDFLREAMKADVVSDEPDSLEWTSIALSHGYVYLFSHKGEYFYLAPDEVKAAFKQIDDEDLHQAMAVRSWLNGFACAAAHLYGVITLTDLADLINIYAKISREDRLNAESLAYYLQGYAVIDNIYRIHGEYLVSFQITNVDDLVDMDEVLALVKIREGKPRYMPDGKTFLLYANPDYYEETPQVKALKKALREMDFSKDKAQELTDTLHDRIAAEADMSQILKTLEEYGVTLKDDQAERLIQLVIDMYNNTRKWLNFGNTPQELVKSMGIQTPRGIHFGPGMVDMVKNDEMSLKELQRKVQGMSIASHEFEASLLSEIAHAKGMKDSGDGVEIAAEGNAEPLRKPGRNDPCPCGSGLKYKKCCGKGK